MARRRLQIYTSNRLPVLLDRLAEHLRDEPLPPLREETVVVPSQGMARWISLELARRLSVSACLCLPFPAALCRQLTGETGAGPDLFDREVLTWRLFRLMGELGRERKLQPLRQYLADDPDQRKRLQLAQRIAGRLDDYQLYRPDLLARWEQEDAKAEVPQHAPWQAQLWRTLLAETEPLAGAPPPSGALPFSTWMAVGEASALARHRQLPVAHRFRELRELLAGHGLPATGAPTRVHVFGITTLPPMFVELLSELSRSRPVTLYMVSPTEHFWGDVSSVRVGEEVEAGFRGHPLLASLGGLGRDFFNVLLDADPGGNAWTPLAFESPGRGCALHALQTDILELVDRGAGEEARLPLDPADDSLRVHTCHSRMREMQVLRDQILAAFDADPTLLPDDVMVLVPDIAVYAPYIQAVFAGPLESDRRAAGAARAAPIPIHIADRGLLAEQAPVAAFVRILGAAEGRLLATDVLELLEEPSIRRRFAIHRGDLPVLRQWVEQTRIRWGEDGAHRQRLTLPAEEGNTWRHGLRRLVLGYGTGPADGLVAGLLPYGEGTAARAELLGRFLDFTDALFAHCRTVQRPHTLEVWSTVLGTLLEQLFLAEGEAEEAALQTVRGEIARLATLAELAGLRDEVQPAVVREQLSGAFAEQGRGQPFLTGRLTFAALKPMRTIPVEVLCVAGLNDTDYPRRDRPMPFDLIASAPRRGDRSLRADDRQLFLETLLAARRKLVLSYVGRSQKDNSECAPSVVLSELLECLDQTFAGSDDRSARELVTVEHPLQAFSPRYFDGSDARLFSYAAENCTPRRADDEERPLRFAPTEVPHETETAIPLSDLLAFWVDPSKYFCQRVLDLRLIGDDDREEDAEPFELHGLDRYALQQQMALRRVLGEPEPADAFEVLRQGGALPAAALGHTAYELADADVEQFVRRVPEHAPTKTDLTVHGEDFTVTGVVDGLTPDQRIVWRVAKMKAKDRLRAWIHHLFLNAARAQGADVPVQGLVIGSTRRLELRPLDDALPLLTTLVEMFHTGQRRPPPFFPATSYDWCQHRYHLATGGRSKASPEQKARDSWEGTNRQRRNGTQYRQRGDVEDPYVELCQRGCDPLGADRDGFTTWAERVWMPMLQRSVEK